MLKPSEQEEVISQADDKLKSIPNYTKQEIEELLLPALGDFDFGLQQVGVIEYHSRIILRAICR